MNRVNWLQRIIILAIGVNLLIGCTSAGTMEPPEVPVPSKIVDANNRLITTVSQVNTVPVELDQISIHLQQAIVAIEDERFYQHQGIDFKGLGRAVYQNLISRKIVQGGSTITQQLAKNLYLGPERTFARKAKEIYYTFQLERKYTK